MKKRRIIIIILALLLITTIIGNYFFGEIFNIIYPPIQIFHPEKIANRAIILVVEDNGIQKKNPMLNKFYTENKSSVDLLFSLVMKKPLNYFNENNNIGDIIDTEGETFILDALTLQAGVYPKIVELKDEASSFENFSQIAYELSNQGYTVDVVLSLHGDSKSICFYKRCVPTSEIVSTFINKRVDFGFVYQTVCSGSGTMNAWIKSGAKVANGSKEVNTVVILAPIKFLTEISSGQSFEDSVVNGYNHEINVFKKLSFLGSFNSYNQLTDEEASQMLFAGDAKYKIVRQ